MACTRSRKRENREYHRRNCSILNRLADLTVDGASLYSADFSVSFSSRETVTTCGFSRYTTQSVSYGVSLCKGPDFHPWCRADVVPPSTCPDPTALRGCPFLRVRRSQCRIGDHSDFVLQLAQAVGRLPGLAHVRFSFTDRSSLSSVGRDNFFDNLVPVFLESICSPRSSPVLERIVLQISVYRYDHRLGKQRRHVCDFLKLTETIPGLEILHVDGSPFSLFTHCWTPPEDYAKHIASFLRTNKSLKSLRFSVQIDSWTQFVPALKMAMELLTSSGDAFGSTERDGVVLQELELELVFGYGVTVFYDRGSVDEGMKVITAAIDIAGLISPLVKFTLSVKSGVESNVLLIMRMEHGALVELLVPFFHRDEPRHVDTVPQIVEEALRLNRGPSVLSLGPLEPLAVRRILSPLVPDQDGVQANTCVSTLKLLNISNDHSNVHGYAFGQSRVALQEKRLEEVANMMKTNCTVEHLEVTNWWPGLDGNRSPYFVVSPPQCSSTSPVVTHLQNRLRPGGNLRSFTFYGQKLEEQQGQDEQKVQCRKHFRPTQVMAVIVTMEGGEDFW